jgi:predicted MFS family arabinose efflux permease
MPMMLRRVLRVVIGLVCGLFWAMTVASVASGDDLGLAMVVGNVAGVAVADRWAWLRRSRGSGVFAATLVGSIVALLVWDALPGRLPAHGLGYWVWFPAAASSGLWWAVSGSGHDKPPAADTSGGDVLLR